MTTPLPQFRVAAVGDSLTKGFLSWSAVHPYTLVLQEGGITVSNHGVSGAFTRDMVHQMHRVVRHRSSWHTLPPSSSDDDDTDKKVRVPYLYVVLLGGTNDLGCGLLPEVVLENLTRMACTAADAGIYPFFVTIPPLGRQLCSPDNTAIRIQVNDGLKQLAREKGFGLIDLFEAVAVPSELCMRDELTEDQLHFNAQGYDNMGHLVFDAISAHYKQHHAADVNML